MATKTTKMTATVDEARVIQHVKAIEKDVGALVKALKSVPPQLEDEGDYHTATAALIDVVSKRKWIDGHREGFLEAARKMIKHVEALFADAYVEVDEAEADLRARVAEYALRLDAKATGLRRAAQRMPAKDEEKARALLAEAEALRPAKVPGIAITTGESLEIVNEKHVPDQYWKKVLDEKSILAALARGESVPGARMVVKKGVRVTPSNAKAVLE